MKVYGREVGLRFTCGASAKIARLCPNNDISKLDKLLEGKDMATIIEVTAKIAHYLSEGYEQSEHFKNPDHVPNPISVDEFMSFGMDEIMELTKEIGEEIRESSKGSVDAVPPKGTKKN